jgi:hypothetical protein
MQKLMKSPFFAKEKEKKESKFSHSSCCVWVQRTALVQWVFRSKSNQADSDSPRGACKGYIFALEVAEELDQWPEQDTHGRQWVSHSSKHTNCPMLSSRSSELDNSFSSWHAWQTGLPGGRVPPVPVRVDARGAVSAAGPPAGDLPLPATAGDEDLHAGAE